jgi:hypothetical protein
MQISISNCIKGSVIKGGLLPVNSVAPVISGTATVGSILTSTTGTWIGTLPITYTYQWLRNGSNIGGATSSTYTLSVADIDKNITCRVTATNSVGNSNATSNTIKELTIVNFKNRVSADGGTFEAESCLLTQIQSLL